MTSMTLPETLASEQELDGNAASFRGKRYMSSGRIKPDGTIGLGYRGPVPPDEDGFEYLKDLDGWTATVPVVECDWVLGIKHQAGYRGKNCYVSGTEGTAAVLYLIWGDDVDAHRLGFTMSEPGVYWKVVDFKDLEYYVEIREDHFFSYWQQVTFGFTLYTGHWEQYVDLPDTPQISYDRFTTNPNIEVLVSYKEYTYRITSMSDGGEIVLRSDDGSERKAHISEVYDYRESERDLRFDKWLADFRQNQ